MTRIEDSATPVGTATWQETVLARLNEIERPRAWLAKKADISANHLYGCLRGEITPSQSLLDAIAGVLGLEAGSLVR